MKLMIVDDHPEISDGLLAMLGGIERVTALAVARSLRQAKQKCRSYRPDVIVLDLHLPDGDGLEALRAIKAVGPNARLIVFSNHLEFRERALEAGALRFFDKPLEIEALIACLAEFEGATAAPGQGGQA